MSPSSYGTTVMCGGASVTAARIRPLLYEPRRRLPAMPRMLRSCDMVKPSFRYPEAIGDQSSHATSDGSPRDHSSPSAGLGRGVSGGNATRPDGSTARHATWGEARLRSRAVELEQAGWAGKPLQCP